MQIESVVGENRKISEKKGNKAETKTGPDEVEKCFEFLGDATLFGDAGFLYQNNAIFPEMPFGAELFDGSLQMRYRVDFGDGGQAYFGL